ncbi:MAG: phospholipase D family protein [Pseudomonadota bacterium]
MSRKLLTATLLVICVAILYTKESFHSEIARALNWFPQSVPSTAQIEVGFSPEAGAEELVIKAIASAKKSILVGAYSFTSKPIVQGLIDAKKRGVEVRAVLDKSNTSNKSGTAAANLLANADIPTRIDSEHPIHHNKIIVIDDAHIETGSFNYSAAAAHKNAENAVVIWNNPELAKMYADNWAIHWEHSAAYRSTY